MACCLFLCKCTSNAQGSVDQEGVRQIIENQRGDVDTVRKVQWLVYNVTNANGKPDSILKQLNDYLNTREGQFTSDERIKIVELANRVRMSYIGERSQFVIPSFFYPDYRSYSPYPFHYPEAASLPKLFIIDKYTQTFGAYEYGKLIHWGLVSSGKSNRSTPPGRYNFNWKTYYKLSNAAPEGVEWHLFWVYNFYAKIGLHVHQYSLPIGAPASHGCVRIARPDAQWNYRWANGWVRDKGKLLRNGTPVIVINGNPPNNRAFQWEITKQGTVNSLVKLPEHLEDIPLGSYEQRAAAWESGW